MRGICRHLKVLPVLVVVKARTRSRAGRTRIKTVSLAVTKMEQSLTDLKRRLLENMGELLGIALILLPSTASSPSAGRPAAPMYRAVQEVGALAAPFVHRKFLEVALTPLHHHHL
jgi:hypothetical protein